MFCDVIFLECLFLAIPFIAIWRKKQESPETEQDEPLGLQNQS
jgi:hypothetical protein